MRLILVLVDWLLRCVMPRPPVLTGQVPSTWPGILVVQVELAATTCLRFRIQIQKTIAIPMSSG